MNVEPCPGCDLTQIRPPCISMMRIVINSASSASLSRAGAMALYQVYGPHGYNGLK